MSLLVVRSGIYRGKRGDLINDLSVVRAIVPHCNIIPRHVSATLKTYWSRSIQLATD
jgi:hypothetical protein